MNTLYYGDNLDILREHIKDETIDLVYLDPPFNSKRGYNLLFKTPKGHAADASVTAFEDTWSWGDQAEREFNEILHQSKTDVAEMVRSLRAYLKESDVMAYLTFMTNRLLELHRVLKPTGSLYLHCDPTASHYLKILLDMIFSPRNFRNEIIWQRTSAHNDPLRYGRVHDVILFYTKTDEYTWNQQHDPRDENYFGAHDFKQEEDGAIYRYRDLSAAGEGSGIGRYEWKGKRPPPGRHWAYTQANMEKLEAEGRIIYSNSGMPRLKIYINDSKGKALQDVWTRPDLWLNSAAKERLGYPTQKPLALLERMMNSSTNPDDLILDPFCGCGTAIHAAEKLGRQWIGIDITNLAIDLIERRMKKAFPNIAFEIHGTPKDLDSARALAARDKYEFQWWACGIVNAQPYQGKKKGADSGTDGIIYFQDNPKGEAEKIIVSVKGGENVTRTQIADLKNTVEREKAKIGLFVTLTPPTKPMVTEATSAGFYESPNGRSYPKIQILTIEGLLNGTELPKYPDYSAGELTHKKARTEQERGKQGKLI